ncbi:MAG: phosphotransferase [Mycobacterium sp.]|nr:phosphotransferase [Mycobacterium sp.]
MKSPAAEAPAGIGAIDPEWLTDALREHHSLPDDLVVADLRTEQIAQDSGFSSLLYRLHLTGTGVPPTVIVKLPAQSEARGAMEMLGGYTRELNFYRKVADRVPLATPRVYSARMAQDSIDFVLVMEDLQNWHNADHLAGLSLRQAQVCIEQLAGLHAWSTLHETEVPEDFPSIDTAIAREVFLPVFALGWQVYRDHSAASVPPTVQRYAERFTELAPQALDALSRRSMLLHGDIRADNMFFDGDQLKVVDFQFVCRGAGLADIGYLISQGLPTGVRRGKDESLVRQYLRQLADFGVTDYGFDEAWRQYRFAVGYLMVLPVITLVGWDALPARSRALCIALVDRAVATIEDIGAVEVFQ